MQIRRKLGLLQIVDRNWAVRRLRERTSSRRIAPRPARLRGRGIPARPARSEASTNFGGWTNPNSGSTKGPTTSTSPSNERLRWSFLQGLNPGHAMKSKGTPVHAAVSVLGNGSRVTAQDTVPFALWSATCHLNDYEEALWATVSGLGDRDTTCAIVGGVVVMQSGLRSIPKQWLHCREPIPRHMLKNYRMSSFLDNS